MASERNHESSKASSSSASDSDPMAEREIPPALMEKLLLRKLDMLERDYLMTVNAQRKPEVIEVRH
jgi:hypothetical protein